MLIYPITPLLSRVASAALGSFFLPLFRLLVLEKILHSSDFCSGARCAPERTKAQRAAPFGKLGIIGFVLHD
jgi:hypothetical protein